MRRVTTLALLLAILAGVPATAEAAPRKGCHPRGSRTVDVTRTVRVYKIPFPRRGDGLYACAYKTRRPVRLGDPFVCDSPAGCGGTRVVGIRGRFVATETLLGPSGTLDTFEHLKLVDTLRRRSRLVHSTARPLTAPPNSVTELRAAALSTGGRIAFITVERGEGYERRTVRLASASRTVVADEGPRIYVSSLAVAGRTAYWKNEGQPRTADFPG